MSTRISNPFLRALALLAFAATLSVAATASASDGPKPSRAKSTISPRDLQPFTDPGLKTMTLASKINGKEYQIEIGLPFSYETSTKAYPLFVVLDGESFFLSASEITRNESTGSMGPLNGGIAPIPEFIIVAIALPSDPPNPFRRNFEYMPPARRDELAPTMQGFLDQAEATYHIKAEFGGASVFLKVLETEILPSVAQHYRVDTARRMLFGHSAGGTFAAFALTTRPELFTDYIIASPGLFPDNFRKEEAWAAEHKDLHARVLLTAGEKEINDPLTIASGTVRFAEALRSRKYPSLDLQTWIIPDAGHMQTPIPSLMRGLIRSGGPRN
jgi:predicted alpha/beta superfamily hydrolase